MSTMNQIEFVKLELEKRGKTIKQMERELGFANGYVRNLRRGQFPRDRLDMIADYLGVDVNYLLTCGNLDVTAHADEHRMDTKDYELLHYVHQLDDAGKDKVIDMAKLLVKSGDYTKKYVHDETSSPFMQFLTVAESSSKYSAAKKEDDSDE